MLRCVVTLLAVSLNGTWGQFWLPETPDAKRYGVFEVDPKDRALYVHFGGDLTVGHRDVEPTPENPLGFEWLHEDDGVPELVHGWLNTSPKAITFYDSTTTHRNVVRRGLIDGSEQTISPIFGLRGAHLPADAEFSALRVRYRGIDAWASLQLLRMGDPPSTCAITLIPSTVVPAELAGGGSVTLHPELASSVDHSGARVEQQVWLSIEGIAASGWREVDRRFVTPVQTLVTLCTGREALVTRAQYVWNDKAVEATGKGSTHSDVSPKQLGPDQIPISFSMVGARGIATWLDQVETMGPLPPIVAKHVGSNENGTMESQVIELTSVIEGLHKRLLNPDRTSYRSRVTELAEIAELALPGVCGATARWADLVVKTRNEYVHRQNDFLGASGAVDLLVVLVKSLRFALRSFLLRYAGIPDALITETLSQTSEWQLFREQAKADLPEVFDIQ